MELASQLEPIIVRYLKTIFKSIVEVQLNDTRKIFDILLVDFVVIFDQLFNDTKSLADKIKEKIQNGLNKHQLVQIQGDKGIMLSVKGKLSNFLCRIFYSI